MEEKKSKSDNEILKGFKKKEKKKNVKKSSISYKKYLWKSL